MEGFRISPVFFHLTLPCNLDIAADVAGAYLHAPLMTQEIALHGTDKHLPLFDDPFKRVFY